LDEAIFRTGPEGVDDAINALKKVQENAADLRAAAEAWRKARE
jgi:hypothetical protein